MKFYQSPLSIGGILLFIEGAEIFIAMLRGAWPTYLAFIFLVEGIVMLIIDYFIRKSGLRFRAKLIIQSLIVVAHLFVVYLLITGKININLP